MSSMAKSVTNRRTEKGPATLAGLRCLSTLGYPRGCGGGHARRVSGRCQLFDLVGSPSKVSGVVRRAGGVGGCGCWGAVHIVNVALTKPTAQSRVWGTLTDTRAEISALAFRSCAGVHIVGTGAGRNVYPSNRIGR